MIGVQVEDRIAMSQSERDRLATLRGVVAGERTQVEAARLLQLSVRQVRRLIERLEAEGDGVLVHGLRGQPSNHRHTESFRKRVLSAYRQRYADFGPTFACEKLAAEEKLTVGVETLRSGCSTPVCGSGSGIAIRTGAGGRGAVASASWCRWTRRFTTGSKAAARRWC